MLSIGISSLDHEPSPKVFHRTWSVQPASVCSHSSPGPPEPPQPASGRIDPPASKNSQGILREASSSGRGGKYSHWLGRTSLHRRILVASADVGVVDRGVRGGGGGRPEAHRWDGWMGPELDRVGNNMREKFKFIWWKSLSSLNSAHEKWGRNKCAAFYICVGSKRFCGSLRGTGSGAAATSWQRVSCGDLFCGKVTTLPGEERSACLRHVCARSHECIYGP